MIVEVEGAEGWKFEVPAKVRRVLKITKTTKAREEKDAQDLLNVPNARSLAMNHHGKRSEEMGGEGGRMRECSGNRT
jgi:hypothetical protein